ncbi:MAG: hypothetical protein KGP27_15210 [Hyphomicrobiales bacterium]|nr:hypothetical protein [Hyphomicrobiales bacterium]
MSQSNADAVCRAVYKDTSAFYDRISPNLTHCRGYEILLSPPTWQCPIMFIGYQPGPGDFDSEDALRRRHEWPKESDYVTAQWRLARNLQAIFGKQKLKRCVGTNAIFFQADTIALHDQLAPDIRGEVFEFCRKALTRMIDAIEPQYIVAIGLRTLREFGEGNRVVARRRSGPSHPLIEEGIIVGRKAISVLHLSGAWPSTAEKNDIKDFLMSQTTHLRW